MRRAARASPLASLTSPPWKWTATLAAPRISPRMRSTSAGVLWTAPLGLNVPSGPMLTKCSPRSGAGMGRRYAAGRGRVNCSRWPATSRLSGSPCSGEAAGHTDDEDRWGCRPPGPPASRGVAQPLRLGQRLELLERVVLDLPDALARDVERPPDLLQRVRPRARQAEAHLDDLALALRQRVQRLAHVLAAEVLGRHLEGRLGGLVLDEVAQLGLFLLADRLLERDRLLRHAQDVAHLAHRALQLARDLLRQRLAAELLHELALHVDDLVQLLDHVDGDADRAALVRDRPRHRLADPPGRVRGELVAAPVVELLHRADEAERALLDEVQERQAAAQVALGDGHDEAQICLDHLLLGHQVPALDAPRQLDLAVGREQRHLADRPQIEPQRIQAGLDRQVDLGLARAFSRVLAGLGLRGSDRL